jgi:hypothetical protein
MYLDAKQDESDQVSETIDALKNILPLGMFNHANLAPLPSPLVSEPRRQAKAGRTLSFRWKYRWRPIGSSSVNHSRYDNEHTSSRLPTRRYGSYQNSYPASSYKDTIGISSSRRQRERRRFSGRRRILEIRRAEKEFTRLYINYSCYDNGRKRYIGNG